MKIEIIGPNTCPICGKRHGKSNTTLYGIEIWIACDCQEADRLYLLDTRHLEYRLAQIQHIIGVKDGQKD